MDLIRLNDAISQIKEAYLDFAGYVREEIEESLIEIIKQCPIVKLKTDIFDCWTSVEDELPEKYERVLVANRRGKQWDFDICWWNGHCFDRSRGKTSYGNVTHWMRFKPPDEPERKPNAISRGRETEWVSVLDRLPEQKEDGKGNLMSRPVMVYTVNGSFVTDYLENGEWRFCPYEVTHWIDPPETALFIKRLF